MCVSGHVATEDAEIIQSATNNPETTVDARAPRSARRAREMSAFARPRRDFRVRRREPCATGVAFCSWHAARNLDHANAESPVNRVACGRSNTGLSDGARTQSSRVPALLALVRPDDGSFDCEQEDFR
jgi:hypothetical protein